MTPTDKNKSFELLPLLFTLIAIGCFISSLWLPLWKVDLFAHNYPQGLKLIAYGEKIEGDLYEINIINHYVGMKHLNPDEIELMALFPYAIAGCILLTIVIYFFPNYRRMFSLIMLLFPIGILLVIQWYLYQFGQDLDPKAPIRMKPFIPLVLGESTIMNFRTVPSISIGLWLIVFGTLSIGFGTDLVNWVKKLIVKRPLPVTLFLFFFTFPLGVNAQSDLQLKINKANDFDTLYVTEGIYVGNIHIQKPLVLIGVNQPILDGQFIGTVVMIESHHVTLTGFKIINSGKDLIEESSGIKIKGHHITIKDNYILDVFFGIHVIGGKDISIINNMIIPGKEHADRIGHAISIWNCESSIISHNKIREGRDGIFLNYTANVTIEFNEVTDSRYALHSMYSNHLTFSNNYVYKNLLGCALMYSKNLIAKHNRIEWHREGSSPYGFLLKDIENVTMEENSITANGVGIYAEGVSQRLDSYTMIRKNIIRGNDFAFGLHSTVKMTVSENIIVDNLVEVQRLGHHLSASNQWSSEAGKGNLWSAYKGYDLDGNGVGDQPFIVKNMFEKMNDPRSPLRAFIHTPSHRILESVATSFPLLTSQNLLTDSFPMVKYSEAGFSISTLFSSSGIGILCSLLLTFFLYHFITQKIKRMWV